MKKITLMLALVCGLLFTARAQSVTTGNVSWVKEYQDVATRWKMDFSKVYFFLSEDVSLVKNDEFYRLEAIDKPLKGEEKGSVRRVDLSIKIDKKTRGTFVKVDSFSSKRLLTPTGDTVTVIEQVIWVKFQFKRIYNEGKKYKKCEPEYIDLPMVLTIGKKIETLSDYNMYRETNAGEFKLVPGFMDTKESFYKKQSAKQESENYYKVVFGTTAVLQVDQSVADELLKAINAKIE
jgi:hypothetical protein